MSKLMSASVANKICCLISRRGYAAAAAATSQAKTSTTVAMMKKKGSMEEAAKNSSWIPDPKTGYYRPENQDKQVDAAELREMLLNKKISRSH